MTELEIPVQVLNMEVVCKALHRLRRRLACHAPGDDKQPIMDQGLDAPWSVTTPTGLKIEYKCQGTHPITRHVWACPAGNLRPFELVQITVVEDRGQSEVGFQMVAKPGQSHVWAHIDDDQHHWTIEMMEEWYRLLLAFLADIKKEINL